MAENETLCSETEDSSEEDIEPKFKYQRLAHDLKDILNKDVVTACAIHSKFIIFGTFLGGVYLLDHQGNTVNSNLCCHQKEFVHTVAVNWKKLQKKHQSIRADPTHKKVVKSGISKKRWNAKKLTNEQRKSKIAEHKAAYIAKLHSDSYA